MHIENCAAYKAGKLQQQKFIPTVASPYQGVKMGQV